MKKISIKKVDLTALLLLLALTVIFAHSNFGKTSEESEQTHAQHDFSQLVSKTLQPSQGCSPQFEGEAALLAIAEDISFQEMSNFRIDGLVPPYPKKPSLILLFSTLLI